MDPELPTGTGASWAQMYAQIRAMMDNNIQYIEGRDKEINELKEANQDLRKQIEYQADMAEHYYIENQELLSKQPRPAGDTMELEGMLRMSLLKINLLEEQRNYPETALWRLNTRLREVYADRTIMKAELARKARELSVMERVMEQLRRQVERAITEWGSAANTLSNEEEQRDEVDQDALNSLESPEVD